MPGVQSAAFTLLIPAGAAYEPAAHAGAASMLAEWITRGAGDYDSRALLSALDNLGVSHGEGAQTLHTSVGAATLGRNLIPAMEIFADVVLRPRLDEAEVEPIRALALQNLKGLEDDPGTKVIYELRKRHFPDPWGRPSPGTPESVAALSPGDLRSFFARNYRPNGAILGVAGAVDWEPLRDAVGRLFGDWTPKPETPVVEHLTGPSRDHILRETQQIQIALAYPTATVQDPDYYRARSATAILGGYSSARLFTEVREKRGLCYSVYASYESQPDRAAVLCYAGTSVERAQETLDVTLDEVNRLAASGGRARGARHDARGAQELAGDAAGVEHEPVGRAGLRLVLSRPRPPARGDHPGARCTHARVGERVRRETRPRRDDDSHARAQRPQLAFVSLFSSVP